jgi:hypothetical protein
MFLDFFISNLRMQQMFTSSCQGGVEVFTVMQAEESQIAIMLQCLRGGRNMYFREDDLISGVYLRFERLVYFLLFSAVTL